MNKKDTLFENCCLSTTLLINNFFKNIIDVIEQGTLLKDLIVQSIKEAFQKGLIRKKELYKEIILIIQN